MCVLAKKCEIAHSSDQLHPLDDGLQLPTCTAIGNRSPQPSPVQAQCTI
mgnify:CR=1 FL=1|jgi:hypothetical protein